MRLRLMKSPKYDVDVFASSYSIISVEYGKITPMNSE